MEKLAKRLASKIAAALDYDAEREAVVAYGLIAIIQFLLTVAAIVLLGSLVHALAEALMLCFAAILLRKYSGGHHLSGAEICSAFSVTYCILGAVLSVTVLRQIYNPVGMGICMALFFPLAFYLVYRLAPVDSPGKPIRTDAKRTRMRKGSFRILAAGGLLSVGLLLGGSWADRCRSLNIALLLGFGWQIFSLTRPGGRFIEIIDNLFGKIGRR